MTEKLIGRSTVRTMVTLMLVGAAVHFALPRLSSLDATLRVLGALRPWSLAASVVVQALSYWASGLMLAWIVRSAGGRLPVARAVAITLAGGSVGLVAGGALGFASSVYRWVRDARVGKEGAALAAWLPTLLNACAVAAAAALGLVQLLALGRLTRAEAWAFGISVVILAAAGAVLAWSARHPGRAGAQLARWMRDRGAARSDHGRSAAGETAVDAEAAWDLLRHRRGCVGPLAGALLGIAFDVLSLFLLFLAARYPIGAGLLLAGYGLPLLIGKVAVVPGGLGVVEGGMVGMYHALGVPAATAVTVVLAYRAVSFWIPNLLGMALIPWLQARGTPRTEAPPFHRVTQPREINGGSD